MTIDLATRRKLRRSIGTRTARRYGTKTAGKPKPRQVLASLIEKWKREQ